MTCPNCKQDHIIERNATTMLCMLCGWKGPLPRPAWMDAAADEVYEGMFNGINKAFEFARIPQMQADKKKDTRAVDAIARLIERHWRESMKGTT